MTKKRQTSIEIKTLCGDLKIPAVYGYDRATGQYINPLRKWLGLDDSKTCSPELIERMCYIATQTLSYQACENTMRHWGVEVCDTTIHKVVQREGKKIEQRQQIATERALEPSTRQEQVGKAKADLEQKEFSLLIMMDGWMIRERGQEWALKPADLPGKRSEWREMKTGIVLRLEDRAQTQSGRSMLIHKDCVSWRGDPATFGKRLWALALSKGLYQAKHVIVVADGALWIWNLVQERFQEAIEELDFYHASQHLWQAARALYCEEAQAKAWVEPLLSKLRHGSGAQLSATVQDTLKTMDDRSDAQRAVIETEIAYFEKNRSRMEYGKVAELGAPIGSGAMESTCSQLQDRFKRVGQFWTQSGAHHLMLIEALRKNEEWDTYWSRKVA